MHKLPAQTAGPWLCSGYKTHPSVQLFFWEIEVSLTKGTQNVNVKVSKHFFLICQCTQNVTWAPSGRRRGGRGVSWLHRPMTFCQIIRKWKVHSKRPLLPPSPPRPSFGPSSSKKKKTPTTNPPPPPPHSHGLASHPGESSNTPGHASC